MRLVVICACCFLRAACKDCKLRDVKKGPEFDLQKCNSLDLKSKEIGDDGARALAAALEKNSALTSLNLFHNSIGADGARARE